MLTRKEIRALALVIIIVIALFGALFLFRQRESAPREVVPSPEPRRVQSYNGIVASLEDGAFTINASASSNPLLQDALMRILFNKDTRFIRMRIPKASPENTERIKTASEEIAPSDMRIGDRVIAHAEKNIRGKEEFTADAVTVVSLK